MMPTPPQLALTKVGELRNHDLPTYQAMQEVQDKVNSYIVADAERVDAAIGVVAGGVPSVPLTTKGDVLTHDGTVNARLPVGTNGQVLTADSTQALGVKYATPASIPSVPLTTKGDLLTHDATVNARLGVGADTYLLTAASGTATGLDWTAPPTIPSVPLTTKGDVLTFSTVNARLPVGTNGQVLTADSTQATGNKWATPAAGFTSPLTTKGDVHTFSTVDARLGVGANTEVLTAASGAATGLTWESVGALIRIQQDDFAGAGGTGFTLSNSALRIVFAFWTYAAGTGRVLLFGSSEFSFSGTSFITVPTIPVGDTLSVIYTY